MFCLIFFSDLFPSNSDSNLVGKKKAEYVDCKCFWGLFRDRNVTLREPIRFHTGQGDLHKRGLVTKFAGKNHFDWWKKGSICDEVGGQVSLSILYLFLFIGMLKLFINIFLVCPIWLTLFHFFKWYFIL